MPSLSHDALAASIAAALGVSPLACGAEPPPASPAPAVSAREVTPWTAPSTVDTATPAADAGVGPEASAPAVVPIEDSGAPEAASILSIADASALPPLGPDAVPLHLFVPAAPAAPAPSKASPVGAPPPKGLGGLQNIQSSCGANASCGAVANVRGPTVSTVHVGLRPRPGLSAEDAARASRALALLAASARSCANRALAMMPVDSPRDVVVAAHASGPAVVASFGVTSDLDPSFARCVESNLRRVLGGDAAPTDLRFTMKLVMR